MPADDAAPDEPASPAPDPAPAAGDAEEAGSPAVMAEEEIFARRVGQRLRAIRQAQALSLSDVEERSGGRWSASAVGAYERGFRNLSLPRLKALADFYRVPVSVLLGETGPTGTEAKDRRKLVIDLEAMRQVDPAEPVQRYVQSIIEARGDFNGKVLSLRHDDLKALCVLVGGDIPTGVAQLRAWAVLIDGPEVAEPPPDFRARPVRRATDRPA
ncbi:MAG TPA: transcriptional regulator [Acidimicrobiales bacterium]|nr:transcriptional regulator [Acidimicrobiales bacterium]